MLRLQSRGVLDVASKSAELLLKIKTAGEESLDKIQSSLKALGAVGVTAFAALSAIATKAVMDFRVQEEATNSLTRAMVNNGIYSKELKNDYLAQATALQGLTTYGDEQIISAQAALQQQIGQTKITKQLTTAVLDFATAQKMDVTSAAEVVGKSIGTANNALTRYGITVDASSSKAEKMAAIMEQLNNKFGGQAAEAATGLGALKQLENVFSDLFETLGEQLAPTVILISNALKNLALDAQNTNGLMSGFVSVVQFVAGAGLRAAEVMDELGRIIGGGLATAMEAMSAAVNGNFSQALDIAKTGYASLSDEILARRKLLDDQLKALDAASISQKQDTQAKEEQLLSESLSKQSATRQQAMDEDAVAALTKSNEDQAMVLALLGTQQEEKLAFLQGSQLEEQTMLDSSQQAKLAIMASYMDKQIAQATSAHEKRKLLQQKYDIVQEQQRIKMNQIEEALEAKRVQSRTDTLNKISTLQSSNNQALAVAGKAAAITQIAIETPVAIAKALSAFPPPFSFVAAGLVGVAMAAQAANIAGVQLADGGIVKARPGGIQATIGEGGQDEAVIPLDRAGSLLGGGGGSNVTIIVNGGLLGSESEAHEFAKAVDRELLKLRQNNESVAFDSRVV